MSSEPNGLFPDEDLPRAQATEAYPGSIEPDAIDPDFPSSPGAPPEPPTAPPGVEPVETPPATPSEPNPPDPSEPEPFVNEELSDTGTQPDAEPGFGRAL